MPGSNGRDIIKPMRRSSYSWSYADSVNGPSTARSQVCNFCQILAVDKKTRHSKNIQKTQTFPCHISSSCHPFQSGFFRAIGLRFACRRPRAQPSKAMARTGASIVADQTARPQGHRTCKAKAQPMDQPNCKAKLDQTASVQLRLGDVRPHNYYLAKFTVT